MLILTAVSALESPELQKHYVNLYNERVRSLGANHIAVLSSVTRDLFPPDKRKGATQISASNGASLVLPVNPHSTPIEHVVIPVRVDFMLRKSDSLNAWNVHQQESR